MITPNQIRILKRTGGFYHWQGEKPGDAGPVRRRDRAVIGSGSAKKNGPEDAIRVCA